MSSIAFSCPSCQQNLEAQPEHAGMEVSCPHCQTVMVVPKPAGAAPEPNKPKGKYSKAESTVQHSATSAAAASTIVRRGKKPNWKLYGSLAGGVAALVAAYFLYPVVTQKYEEHKAAEAAAIAATNIPPPPPELSANEVLRKVSALYKNLPSYSVHGETLAKMDMSAMNPMMKAPIESSTKFSMLLGRPNYYRLEWEREAAPKNTKGAAWDAGKGDFVQTGTTPIRMKDHEMALMTASGYSGTLALYLATSFFSETNSLETVLNNPDKTNNESINGRKCYVITGQVGFQNMLFWVHKDDFLIAQSEVVLGGPINQGALNGLTAVQKKQVEAMAKMKGSIIETYDDIETNRTVSEADFKAGAKTGAAPSQKPTSQSRRLADPALRRQGKQ